jgi:hypothetical protein
MMIIRCDRLCTWSGNGPHLCRMNNGHFLKDISAYRHHHLCNNNACPQQTTGKLGTAVQQHGRSLNTMAECDPPDALVNDDDADMHTSHRQTLSKTCKKKPSLHQQLISAGKCPSPNLLLPYHTPATTATFET